MTLILLGFIFQEFTTDDKDTLRSHDCYGHYEINSTGLSSRVETVASFKCMEREDWEAYVLNTSSSDPIPLQTTELVRRWTKTYWKEILLAIQKLEEKAVVLEKSSLAPGNERIAALLRRWIQIRELSLYVCPKLKTDVSKLHVCTCGPVRAAHQRVHGWTPPPVHSTVPNLLRSPRELLS
ncbi:unnamed protein product [Penicillium camemberti]|uniref:Str. FM013 n=1 Tax=Penicillium camemberti (strain FM 013) TaxID=1429867 RepID=A0A0G4P4V3_PENC3|nr:unnamed protein product [Penicillium camemberti]